MNTCVARSFAVPGLNEALNFTDLKDSHDV